MKNDQMKIVKILTDLFLMEYHIWRQLIQILTFRNDLIDTIKPFFGQLSYNNNNEKFNINEEKHIPFLKSLLSFQLEVLHKFEIIDEVIYAIIAPKQKISSTFSLESINNDKIIEELIQGDKIEQLQKIVREKGIKSINPIKRSFNEIEGMKIPIITECIIEKATKCFKYLLINGIEDPTITIRESGFSMERQYEWDCMAVAIYYGEDEIVKILEEKGIEKGSKPSHIGAAILSYRNAIVKEIINEMKEKNENNEIALNIGLNASGKNNNIKGAELLINNGAKINESGNQMRSYGKIPLHYATKFNSKEIGEILIRKGTDINVKDIIYQMIIILF